MWVLATDNGLVNISTLYNSALTKVSENVKNHDVAKRNTRWRRADIHISEFPPLRMVGFRVCNITASKRGRDAILTLV
jgi:hypothetical protein